MMSDLLPVWYVQVGSYDSARFVYYASEDTAHADWEACIAIGGFPCAIGYKLIDANSELRELADREVEERGRSYADFLDDEWCSEMERGQYYGFERY